MLVQVRTYKLLCYLGMKITMSRTCRVDDFFPRYLNKDLNCPMKVPICTFSGTSIKQIMTFVKKLKNFFYVFF